MTEVLRARKGDLLWIRWLYLRAFPAQERKPFSRIVSMEQEGKADLWVIRQDNRFAGFAATVNSPGIVLLDYLAVERARRGRGVGTDALKQLLGHYGDRGVFVEIESTRVPARNRLEREKRKQFYVNCGMEPMGTEADLFGVRMELLGVRCSLDFEGYREFYGKYYSTWAAEHVRPIEEEV